MYDACILRCTTIIFCKIQFLGKIQCKYKFKNKTASVTCNISRKIRWIYDYYFIIEYVLKNHPCYGIRPTRPLNNMFIKPSCVTKKHVIVIQI